MVKLLIYVTDNVPPSIRYLYKKTGSRQKNDSLNFFFWSICGHIMEKSAYGLVNVLAICQVFSGIVKNTCNKK